MHIEILFQICFKLKTNVDTLKWEFNDLGQ